MQLAGIEFFQFSCLPFENLAGEPTLEIFQGRKNVS